MRLLPLPKISRNVSDKSAVACPSEETIGFPCVFCDFVLLSFEAEVGESSESGRLSLVRGLPQPQRFFKGAAMHPTPRLTEALNRLKSVFLEIPGTQLSLADASRLSGLERDTCRIILEALEDTRFLARGRNGLFVRRSLDSPLSSS